MNKLATVVFAAVGGFVAGILLAPKSGKETRQDIANKKDEYLDKAKAGVKEAREGATEIKEELVSGAGVMKDIAKDAAGQASDTAKRVGREMTETADSVKRSVSSTAKEVKRTTR